MLIPAISDPTTMKGVRRPYRDLLRSENAPRRTSAKSATRAPAAFRLATRDSGLAIPASFRHRPHVVRRVQPSMRPRAARETNRVKRQAYHSSARTPGSPRSTDNAAATRDRYLLTVCR
ncbi:hypothetical protein BMIN_0205 [Bifidobacterium minimum]|uniref:Uncharacterized protein n=1 Tax=Bifidobacterium minimum TaxID=1693 RepID=A0A087BMR3_9BIFI|nr:hypothetical protein BMIN_0205 [Bifidobacterium minimum]